MLNTQLAAAAGVIGASIAVFLKSRTLDVGMAGNGAIAGLVGITAPSGFVEYWAAPIIGIVAGVHRRLRGAGDREAPRRPGRRPLGARPGRHLGNPRGRHLRLAEAGRRRRRLRASGTASSATSRSSTAAGQLGVQGLAVVFTFVVVFAISIATFALIKSTIGLRVSEEEEEAGLDISSHGMYGYPEQFIPQPEYSTGHAPHHGRRQRAGSGGVSSPDDRDRAVAPGGLSA